MSLAMTIRVYMAFDMHYPKVLDSLGRISLAQKFSL
jgi:hypothetical protein